MIDIKRDIETANGERKRVRQRQIERHRYIDFLPKVCLVWFNKSMVQWI